MVRPGSVAPDVMSARVVYDVPGLAEDQAAADPLTQFRAWFTDAAGSGISEPNAMTLATNGPDGPDVRVMLAKEVGPEGVAFFTNLTSAKARQIEYDPHVATVFAYVPMHRQIRIRGLAEQVGRQEVAEYFATRPRDAQIGAWASHQSAPMRSKEQLAERVAQAEARFAGGEVPPPAFWGGYRIRPVSVEFWQGQPSRLHDRLRFDSRRPGARLDDADAWRVTRLYP